MPLEIESLAVNFKNRSFPMSLFLRTKIAIAAATALGLAGTMASPSSAAPAFSPWARILSMQVGWVVDRMLVFPNTPALTNPDGCAIVTNGYIIKETDPDRKTSYAMLLSALLNQREVSMVIDGCFEGRPRIISVAIR
jgi:hypothetical protein